VSAVNNLSVLQKLTVFISCKGRGHCGSGVLVKIAGNYFVLTASHVLQDESDPLYPTKINADDIEVVTDAGNVLKCEEHIFSKEIHSSKDITALKVQVDFDVPEVKFTNDHLHMIEEEFIFRGKSWSAENPPQSIIATLDCVRDENFLLRIKNDQFENNLGHSGAELLNGCSGSGVFSKRLQGDYLFGVVLSVPDGSVKGVNCISIKDFYDIFGEDLIIEDLFDMSESVEFSVSEFRKSITKTVIEKAKGDDSDMISRLVRKMDVFTPGWDETDLEGYLTDLLIWEEMYKGFISTSSVRKNIIEEAKEEFSRGNKKYLVRDSLDANQKYHEIQELFREIISNHVDSTPSLRNRKEAIVAGEIVKLLGRCKIDFRKDNGNSN
jgi:hypothetical protein